MNPVDICVLVVLLYALWSGWKNGILVQLSGMVGIVLGAWVAYKFSHVVAGWLSPRGVPAEVLFIGVLTAVMVGVIMLARLLTRLLRAGGLAAPLRLLGALFAVAKVGLVLGLLLLAVQTVLPWTENGLPDTLRQAKSYTAIRWVGEYVFPYLSQGTRSLMRELRESYDTVEPTDTSATSEPSETSPASPVVGGDTIASRPER